MPEKPRSAARFVGMKNAVPTTAPKQAPAAASPANNTSTIEAGDTNVDKASAKELDDLINKKIQDAASGMAHFYVEMGQLLRKMRENQYYLALNYSSWEQYLDSKNQAYKRTYLSYIVKIGAADGVDRFLGDGMTGAQLIEYSKSTDYADKIPALIKATWKDVKGQSARATSAYLSEYVAEHEEEYKKPKISKGGRPALKLNEKFKRFLDTIPEAEMDAALKELSTLVKEAKESRKSKHP